MANKQPCLINFQKNVKLEKVTSFMQKSGNIRREIAELLKKEIKPRLKACVEIRD
jgi:hypothetical protein